MEGLCTTEISISYIASKAGILVIWNLYFVFIKFWKLYIVYLHVLGCYLQYTSISFLKFVYWHIRPNVTVYRALMEYFYFVSSWIILSRARGIGFPAIPPHEGPQQLLKMQLDVGSEPTLRFAYVTSGLHKLPIFLLICTGFRPIFSFSSIT